MSKLFTLEPITICMNLYHGFVQMLRMHAWVNVSWSWDFAERLDIMQFALCWGFLMPPWQTHTDTHSTSCYLTLTDGSLHASSVSAAAFTTAFAEALRPMFLNLVLGDPPNPTPPTHSPCFCFLPARSRTTVCLGTGGGSKNGNRQGVRIGKDLLRGCQKSKEILKWRA